MRILKSLYIIGSGGFSKQVLEIVETINSIKKKYKIEGLIDDDIRLLECKNLGYEVMGDTDYLLSISKKKKVYGVIAIANGKTREKIVKKLPNVIWENLIHPKAIITKYINLGVGNIICAGVVINPNCKLLNHCNINIGCTLGHDVTLDDYTTLMPGCNISGNVSLGAFSTIGTSSCILQNIHIGINSYIGAGAVVTKSTKGNDVYIGIPAKPIKVLV